jgi:CelD/BcsL family acetyltransferase involved in cellulose biosynthesis
MALAVQREELASLHAEWAALVARMADPAPFLHPAWQRVWLEEFLDGRELLLLAARDGVELVGVAPLLRQDGRISFAGHHSICDYMDFAVAPGREVEFFAALVEALRGEAWEELALWGLRDGSPTLDALAGASRAAGLAFEREEEAVAPRVALPASWEEYLSALPKKHRHELRRKLRRLQAAGELEVRVCTSAGEVEAHLPTLLRQMVESRSDKAAFMSEQMGRFFHRMAPAMAAEELVRLYCLDLDGKPAASVLCFDMGGQLLLYNSGYDPDLSGLSVGIASKALCLQDAIQTGHRWFDFLRGHEAYKYDMGGVDRQIYRCTVRRG